MTSKGSYNLSTAIAFAGFADTVCIPAVHIISFSVSFLSRVDELNRLASLQYTCMPWVFIAQLGEHCSANAEATGSNPVEAPKNFFSGYFRNCLNCDLLRWSHTHFICIPAVHIISFTVQIPASETRAEKTGCCRRLTGLEQVDFRVKLARTKNVCARQALRPVASTFDTRLQE